MDVQPLDFEKPIFELQRRLQELKSHSDKHSIDFDSEVESMELQDPRNPPDDLRQPDRLAARPDRAPCAAALRARLRRPLFHRVGRAARRPRLRRRPGHALRLGQSRPAALRRGHAAEGPRHQGKREAQLRLRPPGGLSQGDAHDASGREIRLPIVTFIDTPGAYPGIGAEERGQAAAIAANLARC